MGEGCDTVALPHVNTYLCIAVASSRSPDE